MLEMWGKYLLFILVMTFNFVHCKLMALQSMPSTDSDICCDRLHWFCIPSCHNDRLVHDASLCCSEHTVTATEINAFQMPGPLGFDTLLL